MVTQDTCDESHGSKDVRTVVMKVRGCNFGDWVGCSKSSSELNTHIHRVKHLYVQWWS